MECRGTLEVRGRGPGEKPRQPAVALDDHVVCLPEAEERAREPLAEHEVVDRAPLERQTQVAALRAETVGPPRLLRADEVRLGLPAQRAVVLGVVSPDPLRLAALEQPLRRIGPDRVEHPDPYVASVGGSRGQHAAVEERGDHVQRLRARLAVVGADHLRRFEGRAARERRKSPEHAPLILVEEVVAPVDRPAERPVPLGQVASAALKHLEPRREPAQQGLRREELEPSCRELDRKRQPVEPVADLRDGRRVVVRHAEARVSAVSALDEQRHGGVLRQALEVLVEGPRSRERWNCQLALPAHTEGCSAGREDGEPRTPLEQPRDRRGLAHDVLEVVEQEQRVRVDEGVAEGVEARLTRDLPHPQCLGDRGNDLHRVPDRLEHHEEGAVLEVVEQLEGDLKAESRLTAAAGARERHEMCAVAPEDVAGQSELAIASDERIAWNGHVRGGGPGGVGGLLESLREQHGQIVLEQLAELVGCRELPVGRDALCSDQFEQLLEPWLSGFWCLLDVDELRSVPGEVVLVLEPRDALAGGDPAVVPAVDADEDVALVEIGAIQVAWRMRSGAELEQNGGQP